MEDQNNIDSFLVQKIREGDIHAFETLFIKLNRILIHFAYRYLKDDTLAENVVQDVFLAVYENRKNLDPSCNIKTFLFTATKNQSLNTIRKKSHEKKYKHQQLRVVRSAGNADEQTLYNDLKSAFHNAIDELPEKCHLIFSMNRFDELSYSEIASVLNISKKTVETQMRRALIHIRKRLSSYI